MEVKEEEGSNGVRKKMSRGRIIFRWECWCMGKCYGVGKVIK